MFNPDRDNNLAQVSNLVRNEGYTDLGWANDGTEFTQSDSERIQPIRELDCSMYSSRGTHKVYVDDDIKEILHVDMSD